MKKKLLFVIESLTAAGAERSLVSLLSALDYSQFDVDLQLFSYGGELERFLPEHVRLLPPFDYTVFAEKKPWEQIKTADIKKIIRRFMYSFLIRVGENTHADKARKYWNAIGPCLSESEKKYDAAIAYSQGIPTFYVADRILASRKFAWVNVGYFLSEKNLAFQAPFYRKMHNIVCVSETAKDVFDQEFPSFRDQTVVIRDRIDVTLIRKLAEEFRAPLENDVPVLLTVALFAPQKGYEITLNACRILKDRGIPFKWYVLGRGPLKQEMERFVQENHLQDHFVFLGTVANPYPYFKAATLYVQTSRREGYGLSIAEARILGKPIVTTEFDAVWLQMIQGKNGLVVPQDPIAVANAVERLLKEKDLYNSLVAFLKQEKNNHSDTVEMFYRLL